MKQRLLILFYHFIFWTLFFFVTRALFLLSEFPQTAQLSIGDALRTFIYGIRMDWAMAGIISLIPGLILASTFKLQGKTAWAIWLIYELIFIVLSSVIVVLDFELYKHWGFRMDATPLLYVSKEAVGSISVWRVITLVLYIVILASSATFLMVQIFKTKITGLKPSRVLVLPSLIAVTVLLIIPIRGSFGVAPMNTGFVFFHPTNMFANHAAINVVWNFGYAVHKMDRLRYPDNFLSREKTENGYDQLFRHPQASPRLIKDGKPNVIIIIMESFTYRFIEPLGGIPGVAPNFSNLANEGILFDNFYATGDRTDKGLLSVLSGYPAQPLASIIKYPKKSSTLPFLNRPFKEMGYHTAFTFGNDIDYANFRSYLVEAGFDHLTYDEDFPSEVNTGKWGVPDEYVFEKFFEESQNAPTPFFKMMMTLSSHEPYEVPMETVIKGDDATHKFMNSAYYADKYLGMFIDKAKKSDWWDNTLIVITADHGHPLPDNQGIDNIRRFKIPMLWLGGALNARDTVIQTIGGQPDIANTVLGQFNQYDSSFMFSNNILAPHSPFAMFIFNNGFGMVSPEGYYVFDNVSKKIMKQEGDLTPKHIDLGKAYMQKLYWDFNDR